MIKTQVTPFDAPKALPANGLTTGVLYERADIKEPTCFYMLVGSMLVGINKSSNDWFVEPVAHMASYTRFIPVKHVVTITLNYDPK